MTHRFRSIALSAMLLLVGCGDAGGPSAPTRSFRMGFSAIPPSADPVLLIPTMTLWMQRADAGLVQLSIPWDALLADTAAAVEVRRVRLPLVDYFRANGLRITVALDVTDGLNRAAEDPVLVSLGHSITDTAVQRRYREYVAAVDTILHPDFLSLAAETNLVRLAAPAPIYDAVVTMVNDAAREARARGTAAQLLVSVQVETAWGRLQGGTTYVGVARDLADFPFLDALGLSSYPYLGGFTDPDSVPLDYYRRLVQGTAQPVLVLEGGWTSIGVGGIISDPIKQARYIHRQAELLAQTRGAALFQITFTDLDLSGVTLPPGSILPLFAHLGLVDSALGPKPALVAWDSVFERAYQP
jgi:hypothetical protein